MSDIVNRLVALAGSQHDDLSIGEEAAAEIRSLRGRLHEAEAACGAIREAISTWCDADQAADTAAMVRRICDILTSTTLGADVCAVIAGASEMVLKHDWDTQIAGTPDHKLARVLAKLDGKEG